MLKNQVGLIALCNPFASAMSVVKRLFMYLRTYFNIASLKRPEARDAIISFHTIECLPQKSKTPENNRSLAPVQKKTITEAREA